MFPDLLVYMNISCDWMLKKISRKRIIENIIWSRYKVEFVDVR